MLTMYPELDGVLDLQYKPVINDNPKALTPAQIEQFNEAGYIDPVPIFEGEDLRRLQHFFEHDESRMNQIAAEAEGGSFVSLHHLISELYDIVAYPRTMHYVQDMIGPDVARGARRRSRQADLRGQTRCATVADARAMLDAAERRGARGA